MKKIFITCIVILVALLMQSCDKKLQEPDYYDNKTTTGIMVADQSVFSISPATLDTTANFSSNMWWKLDVADSSGNKVNWIDVSPKSGRGDVLFKIKSDSNYVMAARDVFVKISPDGETDFPPIKFTLLQKAAGPFIYLQGTEIVGDTMYLGVVDGICDIKVHSNMGWKIDNSNASWLSFPVSVGGGADNVNNIKGNYTSNSSGKIRLGKVIFQGNKFNRTLVIKQKDQFDKSMLTVENDDSLIAHWTPVIGAVSYSLVFTDGNNMPISTIDNINNTLQDYDLSNYFSKINYSGIINVALKALSTDPSIFSVSNIVLSHSHFANGSGDGSEGNEYLISNMRHLNNINASGQLDKHYKQVADLDFSNVTEYIPIGADVIHPFTGTYSALKANGEKYKVSNRYFSISDKSVSFFGMFGVIGSGAVVSDLVFENCILDLNDATSAAPSGFAHVVGVSLGGTVRNIEINNCQILLNTFGAGSGIGSVVGNNANGSSTTGLVENCTTTGGQIYTSDINASAKAYFVGGIVGQGAAGSIVRNCGNVSTPITSRGANTGGVVGRDGTVINCYNRADILGGTNSGGIMALMTTPDNIEKSFNTGNLIYRYGNAAYRYGGILGKTNAPGGTVRISECFNSGNITAEITNKPSTFGGIVGQFSTVTEVMNCYNTGNVVLPSTDATKAAFAGGIAGDNGSNVGSLIANCYVTGTIGDGGVGSVAGERCAIVGLRNSTIPVISNAYYSPSSAIKAFGGTDQTTNAIDVSVKSSDELGTVASYDVSWDFINIWAAPSGSYPYPQLKDLPYVAGNN